MNTEEESRLLDLRKKFASYIVAHQLFADALNKVDQSLEASSTTDEPVSCLITGIAGTGKSTICKNLLHKIAKSYPPGQVVAKDSVKRTIPVFLCAIGSGITIKGLAKQMLRELGASDVAGDQTDLTYRLHVLLKTCETKLILMDEFQHLLQRGAEKSRDQVCDWVKNLMNATGIPVVILGTNDCEEIVSAHPQLSRRYTYRAKLRPFEYSLDPSSDYIRVLKSFQKAFSKIGEIGLSVEMSDERMALSIYVATGGLMDSMRKLFAQVLLGAHKKHQAKADQEDFVVAYATQYLEGNTVRNVNTNPFNLSLSELSLVLSKWNTSKRKGA